MTGVKGKFQNQNSRMEAAGVEKDLCLITGTVDISDDDRNASKQRGSSGTRYLDYNL